MSGKGIDNSASQVPGNDGRYVIVITRWNEGIVTGLLKGATQALAKAGICLLYTSPSPRDATLSRMPSSA